MVKKDVMEFPRNDDRGVTVAFYGKEVYEGVPMAHFSPKSPLNVLFYLLYLHILIFSTKCVKVCYFIFLCSMFCIIKKNVFDGFIY